MAEQLATKKYLSLLRDDLLHEKRALDFYLRHHNPERDKSEQLLNIPEYQRLIAPFFTPQSQKLLDWKNSPYKHNLKYPELLTHKSISGNLVRSKSETLIDMSLYKHGIPYRYECELILDNVTLFPDFTILHPVTGQIFYWEHFGMMDNPDYCKSAWNKLQLYSAHQIVPSINLITTYETKEHPLSAEIVEKLVEHYFL